jgi:membrane-associated phospholipid phosphatase
MHPVPPPLPARVRKGICAFLLVAAVASANAQDGPIPQQDQPRKGLSAGEWVLTGGLTAYGFAALEWNALKDFDATVRQWIWVDNPHQPFHLDNYLQYGPGLAVYGLNALGIHGRHNFRDRTIIFLVANGMMGAVVLSLKKVINAPRPDGSGNDGFPSGHTALAFTGAEFMAQEFRDVSAWYGVAGYAMATTTGFLRIYNDKHWFSEVVTGAGIGILAGKITYWLFPWIQRQLGLSQKPEYKW